MSKIDYSKMTLQEIAALDFKGDLRVKTRVRAGVRASVVGEVLGGIQPPIKIVGTQG